MNMDFSRIISEVLAKVDAAKGLSELDSIRVATLGKSGIVTGLMSKIRDLSQDEKREYGARVNSLKAAISEMIDSRRIVLEREIIDMEIASERVDISLPTYGTVPGRLHPVPEVIEQVENIFYAMGFEIADGTEIEDVYYNFTAANMPEHHPARQMHDTFYISGNPDKILRTHTTPMQIHEMLRAGAPLRIIAPGRVFRSDYDATHTPVFHQVEGLVIDKGINFAHLISCLKRFFKRFFNLKDVELRIRPSYFPFTEPSAEVDIKYAIKNGKMVLGSGDHFLEVAGCGMVHPQVLRNGKIDPEAFTGFAFGFGVERLASLKYGIPDLRGYFEIDKNWKDAFGMSPF